MDFGVRQAAMSNGCLGGCLKALIVGGLILLLGPFALVSWLEAQGGQEGGATPTPRAPEHRPVVVVQMSALLLALVLIAVLAVAVRQQRWRRAVHVMAAGLAVLQP